MSDWGLSKERTNSLLKNGVLEINAPVKVKELVVLPGERLSMQKHENRSEHWFITKGVATVYTIGSGNTDVELMGEYKMFDNLHIPKGEWHQLTNEEHVPLKILEIQYGSDCSEDDIHRK